MGDATAGSTQPARAHPDGPVPKSVEVSASGFVMQNNMIALGLVAFVGIFIWLALPGWWPLVATPYVAFGVLYALRIRDAHMVLTRESVTVRSMMRWTRVSAADVEAIVLTVAPGKAYVLAKDGGSAAIDISGTTFETTNERRLRYHHLEMLRRMYSGSRIWIHDENDTGTDARNRSSGTVRWKWIRPVRKEYVILSSAFALGAIASLI
jgi:hypothetical protein